jgi:hypothetical protein
VRLVLWLKLKKRGRQIEQHLRGPKVKGRPERGAAPIPVEEIYHCDVEDPCHGEKTTYRKTVDPLLVFVHLLTADTELPGHLLLGHAGQQAKLLDPVPDEAVEIRPPRPAHTRASFIGRALAGCRQHEASEAAHHNRFT